jgi:lipid II isoglutaminyl synthase (glutamine-hydrolysing)
MFKEGKITLLRYKLASFCASASRFVLAHIFRRQAANFPGKLALKIDTQLMEHLRMRVANGSVMVVGTNGKTSVTNLISLCLRLNEKSFTCNKTGANLDSGIASALLECKKCDWAVLECDELYLAQVAPALLPKYIVLLNLFRDQLDRTGEIDVVQKSIESALMSCPEAILIYNADDPYCAKIANSVPNKNIAFGIGEAMVLPKNSVVDGGLCQTCANELNYKYRQYGQLGLYECPNCGFSRPTLDVFAKDILLHEEGSSFSVSVKEKEMQFNVALPGAYMVYNILAFAAISLELGCNQETLHQSIDAFNPNNGRLQTLHIGSREVLLNLAKNPTGFNQNINIAIANEESFVIAFFINDKEADGHDVSWIWDIDFDYLAKRTDIIVFAGGTRKNDLQVRLKYANISSIVVDDIADIMHKVPSRFNASKLYVIANYTALPAVKAELEHMQKDSSSQSAYINDSLTSSNSRTHYWHNAALAQNQVVLVHMLPELLNLYGDGGNMTILRKRLEWRGIPYKLREVHFGEEAHLENADLVFIGGGPDQEQLKACSYLRQIKDELKTFIESDGALLAICGGYQILGKTWLLGDEEVEGLGIFDFVTKRPGTARNRLVGNIALRVDGIEHKVVGFENHAGRTYLSSNLDSFGKVCSKTGFGNEEKSKQDGIAYKQVIGTYLHGPLLSKNPEIADALLRAALNHQAIRCSIDGYSLTALDDAIELEANKVMSNRICL